MADTTLFLPNCRKKGSPTNEQTLNFVKQVYGDTDFDGLVAFAIRDSDGVFKPMGAVHCSQISEYVAKMTLLPGFDYYISANTFSSVERSSKTLLSINNIVIDIDCHKECHPDLLAQRVEALAWRLKNDLFDCNDISMPHCIVLTGRGAQLWWCLVPAFAPKFISAFKDVENYFASKIEELISEFPSELQGFRVDPVASTNAAGFFRLPGTINTHVQKEATVSIFPSPRLDLKDLRNQFLPAGTKTIRAGFMSGNWKFYSQNIPVGFLLQRLVAIENLRDMRNNPIGEETRNNLCFAYYAAAKPLYGDTKAYQLTQIFNSNFKQPLSAQELKWCLCSARSRDYRFTTVRLLEFLDISHDEAEAVGLHNSVAAPSAKERKLERDQRIVDLFNQGSNQSEIAAALHITRQTVNKVLKENSDKVVTLAARVEELKQLGKSNQEISIELGCAIRTVERHVYASGKCSTPVRAKARNNDKVSKNSPIWGLHFAEGEGAQPQAKEATAKQDKGSSPQQMVIDKLAASLPYITAERLDELRAHAYSSPDDFAYIESFHPFLCRALSFTENDAVSGQSDTSSVRVEAAIIGCLGDAKEHDGDLLIDSSNIVDWVNGFLQFYSAPCRTYKHLDATQVSAVCTSLCERKAIFADQTHIYLYNNYMIECETAQYLTERIANNPQMSFTKADVALAVQACSSTIKINLTDEQNEAIVTALTNTVCIITGGPGTGKTTIMAALYNAIRCLNPNAVVRACAPTGKAAVRLTEVLGTTAQTIHSLLGTQGRKIKCDYLIVDETSMVNLELLHRLLQSIQPTTHIIFVGDPDQLPCIGGGNPLRDMIASRQIPVVALHQPFRQLGRNAIIGYAHEIIASEIVDKLPTCSSTIDNEMCFIPAKSEQEVEDKVAEITQRLVQDKMVQPDDIQILSPTLDFCDRLNSRLRKILNSSCQNSKDTFCPGDRMIYSENNYISKICNGQVGTVVSVSEKRITVDYNGHIVKHPAKDIDKLTLAYAISIHKAQGSEYPVAIIPIHESMGRVLTRNLIYTAVTRAKEKCILVGSPSALATSMNHIPSHKSLLAERLQNMHK